MKTKPNQYMPAPSRRLKRSRLGLCFFIILLASCRHQPAILPETTIAEFPKPGLSVEISQARLAYLDQQTASLDCSILVSNSGNVALAAQMVRADFSVGGLVLDSVQLSFPETLAPAEQRQMSWSFEFRLLADSRLGDLLAGKSEITWLLRTEAEAGTGTALPESISAAAHTTGTVWLIRDPQLRIHSLRLLQHDLVNVRLALVVEIYNPNAFGLEFAETDYEFYGEGKRWNRNSRQPALVLPPTESSRLQLPINLNFTDMDRRMLDLVIDKKTVRYRLKGTARIQTDLDFLRLFKLNFDQTGSVQVE